MVLARALASLGCACLLACQSAPEQKMRFRIQYVFVGDSVQGLVAQTVLPASIAGYQKILERTYSLEPRLLVSSLGDSVAEFRFHGRKDTLRWWVEGVALIYGDSPSRRLKYADSLILLEILQAVPQRLRYQVQEADIPLDSALAQGSGDCSEYALLAAQGCIQQGWESRVRSGLVYTAGGNPRHSWVECRRPHGEWITLDPTWLLGTQPFVQEALALQRGTRRLVLLAQELPRHNQRWLQFHYHGRLSTYWTEMHLAPWP